jgi:ATP-dependent DNA helicase PIF1
MILFAITINRSQTQSLKYFGIYLFQSIFSHEQLYIALSRVTSRQELKILIINDGSKDSNTTENVVYKGVFHNV